MSKRLDAVRKELAAIIAAAEPARVDGDDAMTAVETFAAIERLAVAGKTLYMDRVVETGVWAKHGDRSPEHWLARVSGSGIGEACNTLETAARLVADLLVTAGANRVLTMTLNGCIWMAASISSGEDGWTIVQTIARAAAGTLTTPQVSGAIIALVVLGAIALFGLQRLLGSEEDSPQ